MNAKDFLDLVDKHPLPWPHVQIEDCEFSCQVDLADHAPQMAAAILRLLNGQARADISLSDASAIKDGLKEDPALAALRDSLPKDLRP